MSDLRVRNLEPWVVDFLRDQAHHAGQSLAGFLRQHLREEAMRQRRGWAAKLKARQDDLRQKYGMFSDSAAIIREDRDARVIVVDASVAAKWFLPEEDTPQANALLDGTHKLLAPAIIRLEVHAAITRRFRTGEMPEAEVRQGCRDWSDMIKAGVITLLPPEPDEPEAIDLALQLKHPLQDCLYLALAQRLQAPLVTADPKFIDKTAGRYPAVRPLTSAAPKKKPPH